MPSSNASLLLPSAPRPAFLRLHATQKKSRETTRHAASLVGSTEGQSKCRHPCELKVRTCQQSCRGEDGGGKQGTRLSVCSMPSSRTAPIPFQIGMSVFLFSSESVSSVRTDPDSTTSVSAFSPVPHPCTAFEQKTASVMAEPRLASLLKCSGSLQSARDLASECNQHASTACNRTWNAEASRPSPNSRAHISSSLRPTVSLSHHLQDAVAK